MYLTLKLAVKDNLIKMPGVNKINFKPYMTKGKRISILAVVK